MPTRAGSERTRHLTRTFSDGALILLALGAGALLPLQALLNGRLGSAIASPLWASMGQNIVGTVAMVGVVLLARASPPAAGQLAGAPLWSWIGGALGALYVLCALVATPRLGATRAAAAIIAGQLVASVLLDQFGVLHDRRPASLQTIGGVLLLSLGAALVLGRE